MLAVITPVEAGRPDQGLPGGPPHHVGGGPIIPPPIPGVWPPAGEISHPIVIPPVGEVSNPIVIPGSPQHPIALPPGTVWPPLPGPPPVAPGGKYAILIWIVGVGFRWYIAQAPPVTPQPTTTAAE
jgi:hypothetical protein